MLKPLYELKYRQYTLVKEHCCRWIDEKTPGTITHVAFCIVEDVKMTQVLYCKLREKLVIPLGTNLNEDIDGNATLEQLMK